MRSLRYFMLCAVALIVPLCTVRAETRLPSQVVTVERLMPILPESSLGYHVTRAVHPPVLDGKADEWQDIPALTLDKKEQASADSGEVRRI